jgi:inosine-uridine nucleoside N-ribohydrolase
MPIPVLIDCDPGYDDVIAIMLALASPEVEVLGITTVEGNQPVSRLRWK